MTEQELLSHKRITPEIAAKYLQDGTTAQEIRVKARYGHIPFCSAEQPSGKRWVYRVNPGLLIKYKNGIPTNGVPTDTARHSTKKNVIAPSQQNMELLSTNTFTQETGGIVWEITIKSWKKQDNAK